MRVIVCGGRDFMEEGFVYGKLDLFLRPGNLTIMTGACPTGVDMLATRWAILKGVRYESYPADWSKGRAAGPLRNRRMIVEGNPDLVIAFPGGRGTANMKAQARHSGVPLLEIF